MVNEKEIAGASYIIGFYKEVQALTHNYAAYLNLMLEVRNKFGEEPKKLPPEVQNNVTISVQTVRLNVHKTYIMYESIQQNLGKKGKKKEDLKNAYSVLKDDFILKMENLEKYVISINSILVEDIIQNLLRSSQDLVKEVYNE